MLLSFCARYHGWRLCVIHFPYMPTCLIPRVIYCSTVRMPECLTLGRSSSDSSLCLLVLLCKLGLLMGTPALRVALLAFPFTLACLRLSSLVYQLVLPHGLIKFSIKMMSIIIIIFLTSFFSSIKYSNAYSKNIYLSLSRYNRFNFASHLHI